MFTSPAFWIIIGSLLVVLFFLIRQGLREAKHFVLSKQSLPLPNCPETLAGLKILHLSDLHLYPGAKLSEIILSLTEQAEPEVIFITGDLLLRGGRGKGLVEATTLLQALAARRPTYLVLGNEDFYEGQPQPEEAWEKTGAILLVNQAVSLPRRGKNFWMVGVDDPHEGEPDLAEALSDVPAGEPALLLAHSPVIIRQPGIARFAVVFAGHTHGGYHITGMVPDGSRHTGEPLGNLLVVNGISPLAHLPEVFFQRSRISNRVAGESSQPFLPDNRF